MYLVKEKTHLHCLPLLVYRKVVMKRVDGRVTVPPEPEVSKPKPWAG